MFDWLKKIIDPVLGVVDKAVVDRDLKKKLKNELETTILEYGLKHEEELTKRHQADMTSDSWMSKNVRPASLIFLTVMFTMFAFTDGNIGEFQINEAYIPVYQNLLITVFSFYFGSRGLEKVAKFWKEKNVEEKKVEEK